MITDLVRAHAEARLAWNENSAFWDQRMGEGNDFVEVLTWPATQRLLGIKPGERVLDIACGNGLTSRRLAALGAQVVAVDFAESMIAVAQARTAAHSDRIHYFVLDATDESALLALGSGSFDAALCAMGLMDMTQIDPLFRALARLLRPDGRFVFSVTHPCFNNASTAHVAELEDRDGTLVTRYSVKVYGYMTPTAAYGAAIEGQPRPHVYFDRPLQALLGAAFAAGFVVDGLEERAFPPDHPPGRNPLGFSGRFSEIPPVLVVRLRAAG